MGCSGNFATASGAGELGGKRRGGKRKRYEYCVCTTRTTVVFLVQRDRRRLVSPIRVGGGDEEVRELSTYYCADCTLVVE